jgi:hypothetical protein
MGGGSSVFRWCSKQDRIDPKISVDLGVGLSIATSEQCASCSLSFPLGNTASASAMTRDKNTIVLRPFSPFVAVFNGRQFTFSELLLYYPAPVRVEGLQADAVLQCNSGTELEIFIPLKKGSTTGASGAFLSAVSQRLDPATSAGLGIVKKDSTEYERFDIVTGQDWSLTNLVTTDAPYFTWVDSTLEQYVKADLMCDRYIGWRSKPGPQVIYFQNPVSVSAADIDKLTATVGAVMPDTVLSSITQPLYFSGRANCPAPAAKTKPPAATGLTVTTFGNVFAYFISVLLVLLAVAIVSFGVQTVTGVRLIGDLSATAKDIVKPTPPSGPPVPEPGVFAGLKELATSATDPAAALKAVAAAKGAAAVNSASAAALARVAPPPLPIRSR